MSRSYTTKRRFVVFAVCLWVLPPILSCGGGKPKAAPIHVSTISPCPQQPIEVATVKEPLTVRITGHNYQWRIRYPGPDGMLDSVDDILTERNLHLPENRDIYLELCSDDYAYTLFVPHFDFLDVAMPDSPFIVEFTTDAAGDHKLLGSQMCGYTHPLLIGQLIVHKAEEFESRLASMR